MKILFAARFSAKHLTWLCGVRRLLSYHIHVLE